MDQVPVVFSSPRPLAGGPAPNPPASSGGAGTFEAALSEGRPRAAPSAPGRAPANTLGQYRRDGPPDTGSDTLEREFHLADLWDIVNPLQHIPIVGSIYRVLTGDTISGPARIVGATLYGGPIGMIASAANAILAEVRGADLADTLVAGLFGRDLPGAPDDDVESGIAVADAAPAAEATPDRTPTTSEPAPGMPNAFAPAGPAAEPVLSGDAALSALLGDLRAGGHVDPAPSAVTAVPRIAVARIPLDLPPPAGAILDGERKGAPTHAFSRHMMLGLEKYRAMTVERGGPGRPAAKAE